MTTEPRSLREIVEEAFNDYGNERDWQKMRPYDMAEIALAVVRTALAANPELIEELGWSRLWLGGGGPKLHDYFQPSPYSHTSGNP